MTIKLNGTETIIPVFRLPICTNAANGCLANALYYTLSRSFENVVNVAHAPESQEILKEPETLRGNWLEECHCWILSVFLSRMAFTKIEAVS